MMANRELIPEYSYERHLWRAYKLTLAEYQTLYEEQEGKCALCSTDDRQLVVDHDHSTNKVRGLLCSPCNRALGVLG